jgi:hypothetical protein
LAARRALSLVSSSLVSAEGDLEELAEWIAAASPGTAVYVFTDSREADLKAGVPDVPTLTVSFAPVRHLRPRRGPLLQGQHVPKSTEYRALEAVGVPVPRWTRLLPGRKPELAAFGEYVVTKPDFGARGADVRIERRESAEWTPPRTELSLQFGGRFNPRIAQDFVYTGPWPRSYRVATLFGAALFGLTIEASHDRLPLPDRGAFAGQSVVSSGAGCTFAHCTEPAVLGLAERAHGAFPDTPLLGVDLVRDAETGQLFVLELNSIGFTWHFSSPSGRAIQQQFQLDLSAQLDGRRRAAAALARVCEARAR